MGPLTAHIGQTMNYLIIVENTGNVPLQFGELTDADCEGISPGGGVTVLAGEGTEYQCHHELTAVGVYTNEASLEGTPPAGDGSPITHTSNKVEVEVPQAVSGFSIEKLQKIAGSGEGFTTSQLTGDIGQTVDYEIIVENTGNVPLTFSEFTDPNCEDIGGGPGAESVVPGQIDDLQVANWRSGTRVITATARPTRAPRRQAMARRSRTNPTRL